MNGPHAAIRASQALSDNHFLPNFLLQQFPEASKLWVHFPLQRLITEENTEADVERVLRLLMRVASRYIFVAIFEYEPALRARREELEAAKAKVISMTRDIATEQQKELNLSKTL